MPLVLKKKTYSIIIKINGIFIYQVTQVNLKLVNLDMVFSIAVAIVEIVYLLLFAQNVNYRFLRNHLILQVISLISNLTNRRLRFRGG
jgi:hypothetical protein